MIMCKKLKLRVIKRQCELFLFLIFRRSLVDFVDGTAEHYMPSSENENDAILVSIFWGKWWLVFGMHVYKISFINK